jgi:hypothetical protein
MESIQTYLSKEDVSDVATCLPALLLHANARLKGPAEQVPYLDGIHLMPLNADTDVKTTHSVDDQKEGKRAWVHSRGRC